MYISNYRIFTGFARREKSSGFTLIELLIVIAILAILATVVFVNLNPGGNLIDSRNSRRVSDIATIETAIQKYSLDNGAAPATLAALVTAGLLGSVPVDPTNTGNYVYYYCKGSTATSYALGTTLETGGTSAKRLALIAGSSVGLPAACTFAVTSPVFGTCGTDPSFCHKSGL